MGKKKRSQVFVLKPWCWYCEREFEDDKVLLQHQKSKHFKCQLCPRKLNTAGGLMVHSQQVHKCDPEPLTNTLPGRDGYDIEIFGMEGVPDNAQSEWKARKEAEAGTALLAAAAAAKRPQNIYAVIPEADLRSALAQHKVLMANRNKAPSAPLPFPPLAGAPPPFPPPGFPPGAFPGMPPPTMPPGTLPPFAPSGIRPPFPPPPGLAGMPPYPGAANSPNPLPVPPTPSSFPPAASGPALSSPAPAIPVQPPKDGVIWPDTTASPYEKRAQQPRYRYTSPTPKEGDDDGSGIGKKRKAAADFL
ncbi:hypothetical protein L202_08364 [Cryptococcus amylolentus CBS 6039]|uniref:C2H2-type domain-containing protein n=2 Tax=Cryptococcus amylolentus TaxID=104669 RepID=A0A1E3H9G2_9TREE|nr:hypothetical protein L202_08364 [Cryptococcus amylolentus CBS 6039]ODN72960.1 hypothetical protein L202_08364 [Cryptococcus amylolentus CBS 6039]ODN98125.1 hypothetical protein I350_07767 [Cryptococcus amylolentus CBS 6273]